MVTRRFALILVTVALLVSALAGTASAAPLQSCVSYHIVQPGENLFRIGLKYGMTTDVLMQANGIFNPNLVYVGQSLCIPGSAAPNPNPRPQPHPQPGTGTGFYYTVRWGDTLASIAGKFGISIFRIIYANGLTNANLIYAGTVLWIPGVSPTPGASYPQWKGEYFNNATLGGQPSLVRNDSQINFNWGAGWPTSKVSAGAYSVRWTRKLYWGTATFRFTAAANNGFRLYVDNVLQIDKWIQTGGATFTADVPLGAGYHTIRMEMFKSSGNGSAYLSWARVTPNPSATPIPSATATPGSGGPSGVWTGYYFANQDLGGLAFTRIDPSINFNWGTSSPGPGIGKNLWSARWISTQQFDTGLYQFNAIVDDGVRIYIDDQLAVNEWSNHAGTKVVGTINLTAGVHTVRVEYFQFGHEALITVWWDKIK